jgi:nitrate reductase delta subunit
MTAGTTDRHGRNAAARQTAVTRLAASWLLTYPDDELVARLDRIAGAVAGLPASTRDPLQRFLAHVDGTPMLDLQRHYVAVFDLRKRACPYLTFWTAGETRNRGMAILRFKQAYTDAGFTAPESELADHLAVVLEFAAVCDRVTGEALLAEHRGPIALLRDAVAAADSPYVHVLDAVVATLPELTPEITKRMAQLAASGPPVEQVGLEPYSATRDLLEIGVRR